MDPHFISEASETKAVMEHGFEKQRVFKEPEAKEPLVVVIIVEICKVGIGIGLPSEMGAEVFVSLL